MIMKTQIDPEWMSLQLRHDCGGGGWAVVEVYDDDFVRIVDAAVIAYPTRAILAWAKMLRAQAERISDRSLPFIEELRRDLASGKTRVKDQRVIPA